MPSLLSMVILRFICYTIYQKQQLELDMEQQTGSKSKKEHVQAVYCHPADLTYTYMQFSSVQFSSVQFSSSVMTDICDPMDHSTSGIPVHHQQPELTQTHAHRVSDAIQPSESLSSPSPPALNISQHQGLFK